MDTSLIQTSIEIDDSGYGELVWGNPGPLAFSGMLSVLDENQFLRLGNLDWTQVPINIHINPGEELHIQVSCPDKKSRGDEII